ncbi:MAG TPA: hypothetical protein VK886_23685 [Vicinamibacterales bacterium]|nr:hypothetical protein [Vicinamibacterales bacterium]
MRKGVLALAIVLTTAVSAAAQAGADPRFSVGLTGGLGTGDRAGGALGASFSLALTPRVAAELEATYADRGPGVDAYVFEGRVQIALTPRDSRFVPQVVFGAAAYRANFNMGHRELFGQVAGMPWRQYGMMNGRPYGAGPGSMWGPLSGTRPEWAPQVPLNLTQIPPFYARRMGLVDPADAALTTRRFTDPAAVFGGGVTFNATKHIYVRPEARALLVIGDGDTYTIGFFGAKVGFTF